MHARLTSRLLIRFTVTLVLTLNAPRISAEVPNAVRKRVDFLHDTISRADELYFKQAEPEISDSAYDDLKRELQAIEQQYPELKDPTGRTKFTGDDRTGRFPVAHHRERMLSLRKSYTRAELEAFETRAAKELGAARLSFVIEPKFDGVAISLVYEKGVFVRAVTRGNGDEGEDVTDNVKAIASLQQRLKTQTDGAFPLPDFVELRGEIFVRHSDFERVNREQDEAGERRFANPRNLAAGTLQQIDSEIVTQRNLQLVIYGIGACEPAAVRPRSQMELHAVIKAWGLPGVSAPQQATTPDEIRGAVQAIEKERASYAFPIDGAVVKVDDAKQQRLLGVSPDAPNWAIAFKFRPPRATTKLRAITIQVGRTGVLTPVAELEPVTLSGTRVTRATLHNRAEISRLDLRIGDFVVIEKAGEIVPNIVGVDPTQRGAALVPFDFPDTCPACHEPVDFESSEIVARCANEHCHAQMRARLAYFAGSAGVQIRGLGAAAIDHLVETGALRNVTDFYQLTAAQLKSAGVRANASVMRSIERSRSAETWRVINGLGIPHVGSRAAKVLAAKFGSLDRFVSAMAQNEAADIPGLSATAIESLREYFSHEENRRIVAALRAARST
jgi:DNA ligase (NAD+)